MKRKPELTPDDIEDLKAFASAVCSKLPEARVQKLVEEFVIVSISMTNMIDEAKTFENYDFNQKSSAIGLTSLIQLYKFAKKNEHAIKVLMSVGIEGEPFLNDIRRD